MTDAALNLCDLSYDDPAMVEVLMRGARRLAHAIDPETAIEAPEPFDLVREIEAVRRVLQPQLSPTSTGEASLLMLLHGQPASDEAFEQDIWRELQWLVHAQGSQPTENLGARAYALDRILPFVMTREELIRAAEQKSRDWRALGYAPAIDLNLPTTDDRKRQAIAAISPGWFLSEYHGWPDEDSN